MGGLNGMDMWMDDWIGWIDGWKIIPVWQADLTTMANTDFATQSIKGWMGVDG